MTDKCDMVMIETHDLKIYWECTNCKEQLKATRKLEKSKVCPVCASKIENWFGLYDDEK